MWPTCPCSVCQDDRNLFLTISARYSRSSFTSSISHSSPGQVGLFFKMKCFFSSFFFSTVRVYILPRPCGSIEQESEEPDLPVHHWFSTPHDLILNEDSKTPRYFRYIRNMIILSLLLGSTWLLAWLPYSKVLAYLHVLLNGLTGVYILGNR